MYRVAMVLLDTPRWSQSACLVVNPYASTKRSMILTAATEIHKTSKAILNTLIDSKSDLEVELEVSFWSLHY